MTQSAEDAHSLDRAIEVYRERIEAKVRAMDPEDLINLAVNVAEALDSVTGTIVAMPADMGENPRWAWIYGILLGWDEVAGSIAKRHEWHEYTMRRMVRYNSAVERLINDDGGVRV